MPDAPDLRDRDLPERDADDKDDALARALVRADTGGGGDVAGRLAPTAGPDAQATAVLRRDRRRVRALVWVTLAMWLVAVGLAAGLVVLFFESVAPRMKHDADDVGQRVERTFVYVVGLGATLVAVAVGVLAMATLATLGLVFAARRATLREVNAGLAAVSRQLGELKAEMAARARGGGGGAGG